ncbi:ABC transporter substrate-binding protein [Acrocarpospora macrocephala]|uniref:Branched-chain amino acid ABC transporter substrate-binding protein n=1 Tax=Acrocarpospora macrocephala TaxID=150177 RepID=A0A5M3WU36_9ACTN|nr:ABC transporter substrate-binding protein [Acrocarpospora macrocephala]GES11529.1 branched-chain amino acid ABC transporter substrate-binding protein [Acrocarpospora macrocephala]
MSTRIRPKVLMAGTAVLALVLAGCGGGDSAGTSAGTGGLKGDPIKLGSILTITNPAWSNGSVKTVNEAWAAHINGDLGGIGGRPVVVESCDDHGDPAKTSQCLNNLIDSGVVALVNNSSLAFGANALPAMEKAGIVNIGGWPVTADEYRSPYNFPATPGAAGSYPGLAVYFAATGAKKLAVAYSNTPSGQLVGQALKKQWETLGGTGYFMTEFDAAAADFTPTISKIASERPDAVILAVGEGAAPRMFQAVKNTGLAAKVGVSSTAGTQKVFQAAGDAAEGILYAFASVPADYDSEDARTYRDVLKKYAPGLDLTGQTAVAASSMQYAYDTLSAVKGELTKESVLATLQEGKPWKGLLTHGTDPKNAPAEMPQVTNPYMLILEYRNGSFVPATIQDPGNLSQYIDIQGDLAWIAGNPPKS